MINWIAPLLLVVVLLYLIGLILVHLNQRSMIFLPSRGVVKNSQLDVWTHEQKEIGFKREVDGAKRVWLMMHGNAGQAAHRDYMLPLIAEEDSFYVLEYPGYGQRPGAPSKDAFNTAAEEACEVIRKSHPDVEIVVIGESIGSGPACHLATTDQPPPRIVLFTPFDTLVRLASHHARWFPASLIIKDDWDNIEALEGYQGELEIYGALRDRTIPIKHAVQLAESVPGSSLIELDCDHNDWARMKDMELK